VVLYEDAFYKDLSRLPAEQQVLHERTFFAASYTWHDLHRETLAALRAHFGDAAVVPGSKAIKVKTGVGRMTADVLPAMQFRRYATFNSSQDLTAHWGVHFFDSNGNGIANYPKYHIDNGEKKNEQQRTGGQYKATVRLFKNFRTYMVEKGILVAGVAPSYFIEGALYNVPDHLFLGSFSDTVPAIINYLLTAPFTSLLSQNGVVPLIGESSTQWRKEDFTALVVAASKTWDNWGNA